MKLEEIQKGVIQKRESEIMKFNWNAANKIREWSRKAEVSPLTSVNTPRPNPDPIRIETVAGRGVKLTVTINKSRNRVRVTVRVTAPKWLRDPNRCIRRQPKRFFLTCALAPPPLAIFLSLALLSSCFLCVYEWKSGEQQKNFRSIAVGLLEPLGRMIVYFPVISNGIVETKAN